MKITAWQLFRRNFKEGEEVVVISDLDHVSWGILGRLGDVCFQLKGCAYVTSRGLPVKRQRDKWLTWQSIRFMSHDGFPCRELLGADGSTSIEREPTMKDAMRKGLEQEFGLIVFGDPFVIEGVTGLLHNPGNDGPEFWSQDGEECLELIAGDGARGMLWHIPTVFHVTTNERTPC